MDVLSVNRGLRYIDQPFCLFNATRKHLERLPYPPKSRFIHLSGPEEAQVKLFVEDLLNGSLQVQAPWEMWDDSFDFMSNRVLLKILAAKPLIDWLDANFNFQIVYLTRHPIPAALSTTHNRWGLFGDAYLEDSFFCSNYLTEDQIAFSKEVFERDDTLVHHVLEWVLENLIPLRLLPEREHWLSLAYEEVLLNPEQAVTTLASALNLPEKEKMLAKVTEASRSTKKLVSTYFELQDIEKRLAAWRTHVSEEQLRLIQEIFDWFDMTAYSVHSNAPTAVVGSHQSASV